jgi:hypothetical protein
MQVRGWDGAPGHAGMKQAPGVLLGCNGEGNGKEKKQQQHKGKLWTKLKKRRKRRRETKINSVAISPQANYTDRLCCVVVPGYRSWGPGFDSRRYQIFWEILGLERGPLSLVRIIEELLEWKSGGSGLENRINGQGDPLRWPRDTLYPQKLTLTSPTSGGRSVCKRRREEKESNDDDQNVGDGKKFECGGQAKRDIMHR